MITIDQIANLASLFQIGLLVKLFLLVLGFFYFVFTIVVYRQISLMSQTVQTSFSPWVKIVSLLQILVVAVLFLLIFLLV